MTDKASELVQGTLDMLILRTLALEPMHGYGIALRIEQISRGVFRVNPGSLFPAFRRLEREGWIKPEWRPTENNRRAKYYQPHGAGTQATESRNRGMGKTDRGDHANLGSVVKEGFRCQVSGIRVRGGLRVEIGSERIGCPSPGEGDFDVATARYY